MQNKKIKVDTKTFQILHSAGRALFQQAIESGNHATETVIYLQLLNGAIDEGHRLLGTQRPAADQFIHLVKGITDVQRENARLFLEQEGVMEEEMSTPGD